MKRSVSILLVAPENPDNIGAVARAMKNMNLTDLRLVHPPAGWRERGKKMAVAAKDLLEKASVFPSVQEAVCDALLVIGTTRRKRRLGANALSFKETIYKIRGISRKGHAVIMFGKESKGLDNQSLGHCDWITSIPSNPVFPSMNLAQAVMIFSFMLFYPANRKNKILSESGPGGEFAAKREIYEVLDSLRSSLIALHYSEKGDNVLQRILATFHGLTKRAGLLKREAQMLKGISRRIQEIAVDQNSEILCLKEG